MFTFGVLQTFQRQVHEGLTQLELINKQYQRLARENRTDAACRLREMANNANQRWDNLQKRVASVLRRLKVSFQFNFHFKCIYIDVSLDVFISLCLLISLANII